MQGDARLFGVTSQIELKSEPGRPGVVIAKASVDETVLARRGVDLRPALQGPLQMTVGLPLAATPPVSMSRLISPGPGWKPAFPALPSVPASPAG